MRYKMFFRICILLASANLSIALAQNTSTVETDTKSSSTSATSKPSNNSETDEAETLSTTSTGRAQDMTDIIRLTESLKVRVTSLRLLNRRVQRVVDRGRSEFDLELSQSVRRLQRSLNGWQIARTAKTVVPQDSDDPVKDSEADPKTTTAVSAAVPEINDYKIRRLFNVLEEIGNSAERCSESLEDQLKTLNRSIRDLEDQLDSTGQLDSVVRESVAWRPPVRVRSYLEPGDPYGYDSVIEEQVLVSSRPVVSGSRGTYRPLINFHALTNLGLDGLRIVLEDANRSISIEGDEIKKSDIATKISEVATRLSQNSTELESSVRTAFEKRLASLTLRADLLKNDAKNDLALVEQELKKQQQRRVVIERAFRNVDAQVQQLGINTLLVYAVYAMIGAIVVLFAALWLFPTDLSTRIIDNRVLIELLSMGFLLLTIIILGTGKVLEKEGLAALLGTIAGYIFARKAAEFADTLQKERTDQAIATARGTGDGGLGSKNLPVAAAPVAAVPVAAAPEVAAPEVE